MRKFTAGAKPVQRRECGTKFRPIDDCELAPAYNAHIPVKRHHHVYQCNHIACLACGWDQARQWVKGNAVKAATVRDPTVGFLLLWELLPVHSKFVKSCLDFFDAVERFAAKFQRRKIGPAVGGALFTEINPRSENGEGRFQLHAHVTILPDGWGHKNIDGLLRLKVAVCKLWKSLGGAKAKLRAPDTTGLSGFLHYARKHPLSKYRHFLEARKKLHNCVLNAVEKRRGRPAAVRMMWGVLKGGEWSKLRARASYEECAKGMTLKQRASDPDARYASFCPAVNLLSYVKDCPACGELGYKVKRLYRDASGRWKYKCKCGHAWVGEPVFGSRIEGSRRRALRTRIRRHYRAGKSVQKIAEQQGLTVGAVNAALEDPRR